MRGLSPGAGCSPASHRAHLRHLWPAVAPASPPARSGLSGVGDAAEQRCGPGDDRAVVRAESAQPLIEPGVALCPGGASELVPAEGSVIVPELSTVENGEFQLEPVPGGELSATGDITAIKADIGSGTDFVGFLNLLGNDGRSHFCPAG